MIPSPEVIAAAQAAQRKWHIPTSFQVAQYGLEGGWGKAEPPGSNNPFGVKALPGQPFVMAMTTEGQGATAKRELQPFRKYASLEEAFDEHARLLATAPVYHQALGWLPGNLEGFVRSVAEHYATANTDQYVHTMMEIIDGDGLRRYDVVAA